MERISYKQYEHAVYIIKEYRLQTQGVLIDIENLNAQTVDPFTLFINGDFSVRLHNRIHAYYQKTGEDAFKKTLVDIANISYSDLKRVGGLGSKSKKELDSLLSNAGLKMKP